MTEVIPTQVTIGLYRLVCLSEFATERPCWKYKPAFRRQVFEKPIFEARLLITGRVTLTRLKKAAHHQDENADAQEDRRRSSFNLLTEHKDYPAAFTSLRCLFALKHPVNIFGQRSRSGGATFAPAISYPPLGLTPFFLRL